MRVASKRRRASSERRMVGWLATHRCGGGETSSTRRGGVEEGPSGHACTHVALRNQHMRRRRRASSSWPKHGRRSHASCERATRIIRRSSQRSDEPFVRRATRTSFGTAMASALPSNVPSVKPTQYVPQFLPCNPNCFSNHTSTRRKPTCCDRSCKGRGTSQDDEEESTSASDEATDGSTPKLTHQSSGAAATARREGVRGRGAADVERDAGTPDLTQPRAMAHQQTRCEWNAEIQPQERTTVPTEMQESSVTPTEGDKEHELVLCNKREKQVIQGGFPVNHANMSVTAQQNAGTRESSWEFPTSMKVVGQPHRTASLPYMAFQHFPNTTMQR